MIGLSGFTFVHNALEGGYPIAEAIRAVRPYVDEVVAVDMQSDDGTRAVLDGICDRVVESPWDGRSTQTLDAAFALNVECRGSLVLFFEADEVYDDRLACEAARLADAGFRYLKVWRIQVEQNFQRIRWSPEPVQRVFPPGGATRDGYTTSAHERAYLVRPQFGFLWDCSYCFRDNWLGRARNNAALWGEDVQYRRTPHHFLADPTFPAEEMEQFLGQPHWTWTVTPLAIPDVLRSLVGRTAYHADV